MLHVFAKSFNNEVTKLVGSGTGKTGDAAQDSAIEDLFAKYDKLYTETWAKMEQMQAYYDWSVRTIDVTNPTTIQSWWNCVFPNP